MVSMPVLDEMMNGGLVIPGKGEGDSLSLSELPATMANGSFLWCLARLLGRMWSHDEETDCSDNSRWLGN
jgi:hypothetical protein